MIPLILGLSDENAQEYSLVLASQGIVYRIEYAPEGVDLLVPDDRYHDALNVIHLYLEENRTQTAISRRTFTETFHRTYSGLFVAIMMFAIHTRIPAGPYHETIVKHYGSSASHVLDGEVYRLVTALFLHGDDIHLAGNMGGLLLFGTSVASLVGAGLGWFMILWSGILGNALNAWFFQTNHLSIGASTAIFGAVGILAGLRFMRTFHERGWHVSALLPLGAGLALLGLLGSSAHSDITAHLFGYVAGLCSALIYARLSPAPPREKIQHLFLVITSALVMAAWFGNRM